MTEAKNKNGLSTEAKEFIDQHLKSRIRQAAVVIGIVNIGALIGIYSVVADTVATKATEKAIASTEQQFKGLTKQFDQLSTKTTDGFASALVSLGKTKAKVEAIDKDMIGLEGLDIKHVKEVTALINKSSDELISIIEANKALKETSESIEEINKKYLMNQKDIKSLNTSLKNLKLTVKNENKTLQDSVKLTNKWVVNTYSSAKTHDIWKKGNSVAVHIDWQKDHISSFDNVVKELIPNKEN